MKTEMMRRRDLTPNMATTSKKIESLSAEAVKALVARDKEGSILLDVRQPEEYSSGHLPGAVLMPLPDLIDRVGELDPEKSVLAYCRSGNRSRAAVAFLLSEGFPKVYSIEGGITAWNGNVATGSYTEGLFLLEGRESEEELISLAVALEEGSRMFYGSVAELTSDAEARNIFITLEEAETRHKTTILEAYGAVTGETLSEDMLNREPLKEVMEGGVRIGEAIGFLNERKRTLLDMLEVSMQVETNALDLYMRMARVIENERAKKVFAVLIDEEKHHLFRLGKFLGERAA